MLEVAMFCGLGFFLVVIRCIFAVAFPCCAGLAYMETIGSVLVYFVFFLQFLAQSK